jgi:hypothetical protein
MTSASDDRHSRVQTARIASRLPAKPGHTMRRHAVQQIRRKIEPLKIFQSIHQPVSGC